MPYADFSLRALFAAIDERRRAQGLSWSAVSGEINRFERVLHPVASSTIKSLATKSAVEGDGVLQMLVWLRRTPESFIPDFPNAGAVRYRLPEIERDRILRFNVRAIHAALETERRRRRATWTQVAKEIGHTPAMLSRMAQGGRATFPGVVRITRWLDRPAVEFTHASAF